MNDELFRLPWLMEQICFSWLVFTVSSSTGASTDFKLNSCPDLTIVIKVTKFRFLLWFMIRIIMHVMGDNLPIQQLQFHNNTYINDAIFRRMYANHGPAVYHKTQSVRSMWRHTKFTHLHFYPLHPSGSCSMIKIYKFNKLSLNQSKTFYY